jgi:hypothetical protein
MDLRVTLRTDDGALISMKSFGLRHGPPEVMAAEDGALIHMTFIGMRDDESHYLRTLPRFETAAPKYAFLNRLLAVGIGEIRPEGPVHAIEEIL